MYKKLKDVQQFNVIYEEKPFKHQHDDPFIAASNSDNNYLNQKENFNHNRRNLKKETYMRHDGTETTTELHHYRETHYQKPLNEHKEEPVAQLGY